MLGLLEPGDYFGISEEQYGGDGLSVMETCFADDLIIPQHEHVNAFFCFVTGGALRGRGKHAPVRTRRMSLTLFPAGLPHANCWHGAGGRLQPALAARPPEIAEPEESLGEIKTLFRRIAFAQLENVGIGRSFEKPCTASQQKQRANETVKATHS